MKILIDECIGYGIYDRIKPYLDASNPPIEHKHMLDFNQRQGVGDDEWVPRAAAENWIVITADSGKAKLGIPLQQIMPKYGVTGIYMSGKLQQRSGFTKMQAIVSILHQLPRVEAAPKGTRFRLQMTADDEGFTLREWTIKSSDSSKDALEPGSLF